MGRIKFKTPMEIDHSLIEIGDEISVEHKADRGIQTILKGIVGDRIYQGDVRLIVTIEGATLLAWEPKRKGTLKIFLHSRATQPQTTLFDDDALSEIRERIK